MIAALLLLALADPPATIDGLPIGGLPRQVLPPKGCAAYLFTIGQTRTLAVMAGADALRIALDGKPLDIARATATGPVAHGLSRDTEYRGTDVTARLTMTIEDRADLAQGAAVPDALLMLERPGKDAVAIPLAGLVGCAA
ncbi:hypothetical protein ASG29_10275 [Sphingomonas sp. Leaf412]|uniref:hypothetical protein n=1 Tax=Sphingomonas sp. Leaf412 TaxID=1736370 RepID=UPI0006F4333B|nr:hypothetical protein [Sphingomonas sp. Leaf412]KQT32206.1 hypothetical protein ASG29_10275 [Sphingomonas sp. Leaf412]